MTRSGSLAPGISEGTVIEDIGTCESYRITRIEADAVVVTRRDGAEFRFPRRKFASELATRRLRVRDPTDDE